ncbi:hypothetical protein ABPG77_002529 [Micractinium sp. CCAP 211/92]
MATRGRHARDDGQKEFTGRVHHWSYAWVTSKQPKTKELKFRRWQQTDERLPELAGPRHSYIVPAKDPDAKPYPRMLAPVSGGGAMPVSAAMGMKRGKSQAALTANGGAAPAEQAPAPPPAAPKIKLRFTLGQRLEQATAGMDAVSGFVASPTGLAPAAAGGGAAGKQAAAVQAEPAGGPPPAPAAGAMAAQAAAPQAGVAPAPPQQQQQQSGQPSWHPGSTGVAQQQGPPAGGAPPPGQLHWRPPV